MRVKVFGALNLPLCLLAVALMALGAAQASGQLVYNRPLSLQDSGAASGRIELLASPTSLGHNGLATRESFTSMSGSSGVVVPRSARRDILGGLALGAVVGSLIAGTVISHHRFACDPAAGGICPDGKGVYFLDGAIAGAVIGAAIGSVVALVRGDLK